MDIVYTVYKHTNIFNSKVYIGMTGQAEEFEEDNKSGINKCCLGILKSYHKRGWSYDL